MSIWLKLLFFLVVFLGLIGVILINGGSLLVAIGMFAYYWAAGVAVSQAFFIGFVSWGVGMVVGLVLTIWSGLMLNGVVK